MKEEALKELLSYDLSKRNQDQDERVEIAQLLGRVNIYGSMSELPKLVQAAKGHVEATARIQSRLKESMRD